MTDVRKAVEADLPRVAAIYDALHTAEESGRAVIGWIRGVYPTAQTAREALDAGDLYVMEDGNEIVASAKINREQVPEYTGAAWLYPDAPPERIMVLHTLTVDPSCAGKGYGPAEKNPDAYHGTGPFRKEDGAPRYPSKAESFSGRFGKELCALAREDKRICALTAAMTSGTGLSGFAEEFPDRFFDVGIAEEHAVSMTAGMAKQGLIPVFAVYSTFFQRSYDMLIHDIAIDKLHAVFCVDRAGLVGDDGETHHGLFDLGFLKTVPGITVLCPASLDELSSMLKRAVHKISGPVAVRYPRGGENHYSEDHSQAPACVLRQGSDITLVTFGSLTGSILLVADRLAQDGVSAEVVKLNQIVPLPTEIVLASLKKTGRLLLAQECVSMGGPGEVVMAAAAAEGIVLKGAALCSCGEAFVPHGTIPQLRSLCGLDVESLYKKALEVMRDGN